MTKENQKTQKVKTKRQKKELSFFKVFILVLLGGFLFFLTPLPGFLVSLIPQNYISGILAPYYQETELNNEEILLDEPLKYEKDAPYAVLGRNSGVCFKFYSTRKKENLQYIDAKRLENAFHGKKIAEIIVIDKDKNQYTLDETSLTNTEEHAAQQGLKRISFVCQKIGRGSIYLPKEISAIYIRPIKPFRPVRITWVTHKDWH